MVDAKMVADFPLFKGRFLFGPGEVYCGHSTALQINGFLESEGNYIGRIDAIEDFVQEIRIEKVAVESIRRSCVDIPGDNEEFQWAECAERFLAL